MKHVLLLLLTTLSLSAALAQERTVIQYTDDKVTGVKNVEVPVGPAMPDFAQADANDDGCINQKEAWNVGIPSGTFKKFARNGCLNPQGYQAAAEAPSMQ